MVRIEGQCERTVLFRVVVGDMRVRWVILVGKLPLAHGVGNRGYRDLVFEFGVVGAQRERNLRSRSLDEGGRYHGGGGRWVC